MYPILRSTNIAINIPIAHSTHVTVTTAAMILVLFDSAEFFFLHVSFSSGAIKTIENVDDVIWVLYLGEHTLFPIKSKKYKYYFLNFLEVNNSNIRNRVI